MSFLMSSSNLEPAKIWARLSSLMGVFSMMTTASWLSSWGRSAYQCHVTSWQPSIPPPRQSHLNGTVQVNVLTFQSTICTKKNTNSCSVGGSKFVSCKTSSPFRGWRYFSPAQNRSGFGMLRTRTECCHTLIPSRPGLGHLDRQISLSSLSAANLLLPNYRPQVSLLCRPCSAELLFVLFCVWIYFSKFTLPPFPFTLLLLPEFDCSASSSLFYGVWKTFWRITATKRWGVRDFDVLLSLSYLTSGWINKQINVFPCQVCPPRTLK